MTDDRASILVDKRTVRDFNREKGDKNQNDFLLELLKEHEELRTLKQRLRDLEKQQNLNRDCQNGEHCAPQTIQETSLAIQSDVPLGMSEETNPEKEHLVEILRQASDDDAPFDCKTYCRNERGCNFAGKGFVGEIEANHCYRTKYPYEYKGYRVCKFMYFRDAEDLKNPCPMCKAPKAGCGHIYVPKDRIIRDPQDCWVCYKTQIERRKQQQETKALTHIKKSTDPYSIDPRKNFTMDEDGDPFYYSNRYGWG